MRVNLYGNVCNNAYVIAKFLRHTGVDAHLFVERGFPWLPEHEDPELENAYPDWIHVTGDLRPRRYGLFDRQFVRRLGECDIAHVFYWGPIWARKTGRPFVFQAYGGDLHVLPFLNDSWHHRYLAARQRCGIQAADVVFLTSTRVRFCWEAVTKLGLERTRYMPLPIDANRFRPLAASEVRRMRTAYEADWIFFHPTRQLWSRPAVWEDKANDRIFRAFARFLKETGRRAVLIAIEHGPDVAASKRLVEELGIAHQVQWIRPKKRHELVAFYNVADAVIDQFSLGDYGGCAFEAWACGKPVFLYLDLSGELSREDPAVINVRTVDEIHRALVEYTDGGDRLQALGAACRQWVLAHMEGSVLAKRYLVEYERTLASRSWATGGQSDAHFRRAGERA